MESMQSGLAAVLLVAALVISGTAFGHGDEDHSGESRAVEAPSDSISAAPPSPEAQPVEAEQSATGDHTGAVLEAEPANDAVESPAITTGLPPKPDAAARLDQALDDFSLADFPTLHPMVVHVPVIMIPVAFVFALIAIFVAGRQLVVLAVGFATVGVSGGYIAAFPMHPHTQGLSEAALRTLQQHDFFAYSTLAITAFAVVVGLFALFRPTFFSKGILAAVLLLASLCVSITAHYGGTLTYIHGVGVNGNFLDSH